MKAIIVGGGTGGHIIPGINISNELIKLGYETIYIGSRFGIEYNMNIEMKKYFLPISGWVRETITKRILFFFRIAKSLILSYFIIKRENPDFILLTGGFVTIPFIIIRIFIKKPLFLVEINSIPGLASKIISYFSDLTFTGFELTKNYLYHNRNVHFTGIPVSDKLKSVSRKESAEFFGLKDNKNTILIFGGSRGARKLNMLSDEIIEKMKDYQFIILGRDDISNDRVKSMKFLNEMEYAYNLSDFIIARAGAMTCGEIMFLGKPAILIPYPYAYKDHQYLNAIELQKKMKNIYVIRENDLNIENIIEIIKNHKKENIKSNMENPSKIIGERIDKYVRRI